MLLSYRSTSKTPATPKMEFFVTLVEDPRLQTNATGRFILDVAMVLDTEEIVTIN